MEGFLVRRVSYTLTKDVSRAEICGRERRKEAVRK